MAEAPPVTNKGLKDLKKEVTCPVCHDVFEEPKILPCCHYYCKNCIQGLIDFARRANRPFECPECRLPTTVPNNDPNQLMTAFFINRLKEVEGKMEKAHGKVEAPCEQCSGGVSVAFCRQCTEFICAECVTLHIKLKVYFGHKVVTIEELKKGEVKQILVSKPPPMKCVFHDEPMKAFCYDCNQLICRDCIVIDHAGHKCEFAKKAAPQVKQELVEHLAPLKEVQSNLCKAAEVVQVTKSEVVAQGASVAENIEQSFRKLQEILEKHQNRLLVEASDTVEKKVTHLSTQEKGLNMATAVIQSLEDFVEQNLENSTDEELMTIHKQILSRIEKEAEVHRKGAIDLEPVEIADLKVEINCAEKINQSCQTNAELYQLADPSKCKGDGPGLNRAEVNQQTHVIVHTMLHNGAPTKKPQKVTAELKSLVNGSVSQLEGVRKEENKYEIQFSSAVRGHHQLSVNINDQPIAGSPFPVYMNRQLGKRKPVRIIGNPYGVTLSSTEVVPVTDKESFAVFDKKERNLYIDQFPKTWDKMPVDLSTGKEACLHVVDLNPGSSEYSYVVHMLSKTLIITEQQTPTKGNPTGTGYTSSTDSVMIVRIQRVQNPGLYLQYAAKKSQIDKRYTVGTAMYSEKMLFHGPSNTKYQNINNHGFNRSSSGRRASAFGAGVYFARDASYAARDLYSPRDTNGMKYIYLARVLTGEYTVANSTMIDTPENPKYPNTKYDSVVDNVINPLIYVVFHDASAYPEYLVTLT